MIARTTRFTLLLALGVLLLETRITAGAPPAPCEILPADAWSSVMGYKATATPGDMFCTYEGPGKTGGGQFRIIAIVGSSTEAEASAKRMQGRQGKGSLGAHMAVVDSQGPVVFSIALFQHAATESTGPQLQKLVAAAKQHLAK